MRKINIKKIKYEMKKWSKLFANPHFILCFGLAWMITNGWSYLLIGIGTACKITWMTAIGSTYVAFLWMPFTPEKIVTIAISVWLFKKMFPDDDKMIKELVGELKRMKSEGRKNSKCTKKW